MVIQNYLSFKMTMKKKNYFGKKSQIVRLLDRNYQQRKCDLFQGKLRQKNATLEEFHR